jgi:hypothetical protein
MYRAQSKAWRFRAYVISAGTAESSSRVVLQREVFLKGLFLFAGVILVPEMKVVRCESGISTQLVFLLTRQEPFAVEICERKVPPKLGVSPPIIKYLGFSSCQFTYSDDSSLHCSAKPRVKATVVRPFNFLEGCLG